MHNYLKLMVHWVEPYETAVKNGWRSRIPYGSTKFNQTVSSFTCSEQSGKRLREMTEQKKWWEKKIRVTWYILIYKIICVTLFG